MESNIPQCWGWRSGVLCHLAFFPHQINLHRLPSQSRREASVLMKGFAALGQKGKVTARGLDSDGCVVVLRPPHEKQIQQQVLSSNMGPITWRLISTFPPLGPIDIEGDFPLTIAETSISASGSRAPRRIEFQGSAEKVYTTITHRSARNKHVLMDPVKPEDKQRVLKCPGTQWPPGASIRDCRGPWDGAGAARRDFSRWRRKGTLP